MIPFYYIGKEEVAMRLIDADELIESFSWSEVCRLSIKEIIKIIREAPTIEERSKDKGGSSNG